MARKKDRYRAYVYEETAHSGKGILAAVLGGVSLLIFLLLAGNLRRACGRRGRMERFCGLYRLCRGFLRTGDRPGKLSSAQ